MSSLLHRPRRLRRTDALRRMVRETALAVDDLVFPMFVVPGRGVVLNVMSLAWFNHFADLVPNHLITADAREFPAPFNEHAEALGGRSVLVHKADRFPVECVVRV